MFAALGVAICGLISALGGVRDSKHCCIPPSSSPPIAKRQLQGPGPPHENHPLSSFSRFLRLLLSPPTCDPCTSEPTRTTFSGQFSIPQSQLRQQNTKTHRTSGCMWVSGVLTYVECSPRAGFVEGLESGYHAPLLWLLLRGHKPITAVLRGNPFVAAQVHMPHKAPTEARGQAQRLGSVSLPQTGSPQYHPLHPPTHGGSPTFPPLLHDAFLEHPPSSAQALR